MSRFLKPGDRFLEYRLLEMIGEGGMGIVFKAIEDRSDDIVAIKMLSPKAANREDFVARFDEECRFYPKLKHLNIVRMRRTGVAHLPAPPPPPPPEPAPPAPPPIPFIVMDMLEGKTLRRILQKYHRLDYLNTLHILIQIADPMMVAHDKGIVHRDLKPENIMVGSSEREKGHVWIMDFGIATDMRRGLNTEDMPDVGTARYMAPEQVRKIFTAGKKGQRVKVDHRADIYAFGVIAYEVITGQHHFINDQDPPTFQETLAGHLSAEPTPVHKLVPDCPEFVWPIIAKCLAINPDERYQSFDDVLADLQDLVRESVPPTHPLGKRVIADRVTRARRAAFASLPNAPSDGVPKESDPASRAAPTHEPHEPSGRDALTPEPPNPEPVEEAPPRPSSPPQAAVPAALAPTVPAVRGRTGVADAPSEELPETTTDDVETEPLRLTLPLLNYVPKASPLPFVRPAAAPFVPSVPLLQPKRGVGYTTKLQRPEIPSLDSSAPASRAGATPRPPEPTTKTNLPAVGLPPPVLSAEAAFALPPPPLRPPWVMNAASGGGTPRSVTTAGTWPAVATQHPPTTPNFASAGQRPAERKHGAALPPPAQVRFGPPPVAPVSSSATALRTETAFTAPTVATPSVDPRAPTANTAGRGNSHGPGTRLDSAWQPPPSTPPKATPSTPTTMSTFSRLSRRRRLVLAPLIGLAIVLTGSTAMFALTRPQAATARQVVASASTQPVSAGTPSTTTDPSTVASAESAPSAAPVPVVVARVTEVAPQPMVSPDSGTPVPAMQPTQAPVPKPPKLARPSSVAHQPPSRTPVIPLVGD